VFLSSINNKDFEKKQVYTDKKKSTKKAARLDPGGFLNMGFRLV